MTLRLIVRIGQHVIPVWDALEAWELVSNVEGATLETYLVPVHR